MNTQEEFRPLTVAGMMSGTSGDGIDVALVRIAPKAGGSAPDQDAALALELLRYRGFPFPPVVRKAVLAAQDSRRTSTAELAHLHWRLGLAYAEAYAALRAEHDGTVDLVGCHGQTIYHQGVPAPYAGEHFACTWQIGEMAPLARAAGVPVVSNFRPADMAVGGHGAPLVPLLDKTLYRDAERTRILQNIGGISNLTVVPPFGSDAPVIAFDTGPGNMVMDTLMQQLFGKPFDDGGEVASRGQVLQPVIEASLHERFYAEPPPRSAGREQFGDRFTAAFLKQCRMTEARPEDVIATATALTAHSIALAIRLFVTAGDPSRDHDLIIAGGGARNATLLTMLKTLLTPERVRVLLSSDPSLPAPLPVEAKEAVAFALLAYMSFHGRAGNVPSATGASQPVVLGQVTCG